MRTRLLALAGLSVVVAGCGSATPQAAGGQPTSSTTSSATASASPAASSPTAASSSPAPAGSAQAGTPAPAPSAAGGTCAKSEAATVGAGALTGLEFVSPTQGWAVGQDTILATADGGAHWTAQLSGKLNLMSVDFISATDGWAVGATSLLATTDGGARWTALPEPCQTIRSVHFISPTTGFAVAGGQNLNRENSPVPSTGGVMLSTTDGGRTWQAMTAPANVQAVCFSDPQRGWLGAGGVLYRTANGGKNWTALTSTAVTAGSGDLADMNVECANDGTAWALRVGPGAAMSQEPHVGFYANQHGAVPLFAEQYFQAPGAKPTVPAPGSDAGPFSAIDSATAAFIDWCSACGMGTAPWDLVSNSGTAVGKMGNVSSITVPQAVSFQSSQVGWVAGSDGVYAANTGASKAQERIVATTNGGRTWHVEWSGPWTAN